MQTHNESQDKHVQRLKGRSGRSRSLGTKLTPGEERTILAAAESQGKAPSEWAREALLKEALSASKTLRTEHLMAEIISLQQFLTNALYPIVCGTQMTAEQYRELMRNVKSKKRRSAREAIAQYLAEGEEEHHG